MVRPRSYSISLTFKWQSTEVVLVAPLTVGRSVLWNRVCPCFHRAVCWIVFWELDHKVSLNFGMLPRKPYQVVHARFFGETFFAPRNWGNGPKRGQKYFFFNLKKNLGVNFPWVCSVMKIHICCVPVQIFYLGKILSLRYRPKSSQPFRLQNF